MQCPRVNAVINPIIYFQSFNEYNKQKETIKQRWSNP
jgi:hypothetical protein